MTGQPHRASTGGISAEFGYYPIHCNMETDQFSIQTLSDHEAKVAAIIGDVSVIKDWLYPGAQQQRDMMSGNLRSLPYSARIFGLPKTHALTLHRSESHDDIDFVIWCLSFFTGMRLTTTEASFLDSTPIKPGKLVDFTLRRCTVSDAIQLALNYLELERGDPSAPKRVAAVIHALFLAQYPQNLPFEQFQYLYMALDACFKLLEVKDAPKPRPTHAGRIQWMCEKFDIPVPEWAESPKITPFSSPLSKVRNDTFHEAIFFDAPLGFSIYGGNKPDVNPSNVPLQMKALVCRLLVAILGRADVSYVKSAVNTRMIHSLELNT
jgi:hypothetical protein